MNAPDTPNQDESGGKVNVQLADIIKEMDPLGLALFEAAQARAVVAKLEEKVQALAAELVTMKARSGGAG